MKLPFDTASAVKTLAFVVTLVPLAVLGLGRSEREVIGCCGLESKMEARLQALLP